MRISDWSSDVCSSDLPDLLPQAELEDIMMSTDQSFVPDFARVENDALAGQLLASFWQPIALSQNYVAGKARRIKILGTHYTLYRGADGHMRLVQDRCPHRGTSLDRKSTRLNSSH